jgi:hypothetical protein
MKEGQGMKPPALYGAEREALIASKIAYYEGFGDVILREDLFGHTYLWNVGNAAHIVKTSNRQPQTLVLADYGITEELCRKWRPGLDEDMAMRLDLDTPQIVAVLEDRTVILCCWLRLFKAIRQGVTELPAYWLSPEDAEGCLVLHLEQEGGES